MPKQPTRSRKPIKSRARIEKAVAGTPIRFEDARSKRKPKQSITAVIVEETNPVPGFIGFLREHAIVGLAVAFAISTQVQALVKQLISSFIDPLYGLFFTQKLSDKVLHLHWHGREQTLGWGAFAYTMLDFIFVLAVIYAIIKIFNLDKLDKPKQAELEVKESK